MWEEEKEGGSPTGGIFAALWPWTKTISWDNLVKDHSFPRGTLQRGRFFFATRLVNSNRHWLRSALPLRTNEVLLFVEQKSKFFLLINHSKYSVEISKDTEFYRSHHFANWESFLPVPISTTFFGRFDCAISPRTENWTTRFQVSFQQWVVVSPSFHFHSRKTDISTYVYEVARNSYSIDRFLFEPRWIYLEVKERNNGEEGETGGEGAGNKESFTFFHFPRRIKGEEPWKEGKGRRRQKRNIVGKWKGIETLHARSPPPVSFEAE